MVAMPSHSLQKYAKSSVGLALISECGNFGCSCDEIVCSTDRNALFLSCHWRRRWVAVVTLAMLLFYRFGGSRCQRGSSTNLLNLVLVFRIDAMLIAILNSLAHLSWNSENGIHTSSITTSQCNIILTGSIHLLRALHIRSYADHCHQLQE